MEQIIKQYNNKKKKYIMFTLLSFLLLTGITGYLYEFKYNFFHENLFWIFSSFFVFIFISVTLFNRFEYKIKKTVLKPILEENLDIRYYPNASLSKKVLEDSELIKERYDIFEGSDLIVKDNCLFSYIELKRKEKITRTYDEGKTETKETEVTVFSGFLGTGSFNYKKDIKGKYFIKKNKIHLDDVLPIFNDKERIKLDSPEFEKKFDVYGTDQIEGRYLFDFLFMKKILKLSDNINFDSLSIKNDKFYILISNVSINISFFKNIEKNLEENLSKIKKICFIYDFLNEKKHLDFIK